MSAQLSPAPNVDLSHHVVAVTRRVEGFVVLANASIVDGIYGVVL